MRSLLEPLEVPHIRGVHRPRPEATAIAAPRAAVEETARPRPPRLGEDVVDEVEGGRPSPASLGAAPPRLSGPLGDAASPARTAVTALLRSP